MTVPTVSVVVATYNYAQYLAQALDSIVAQSFVDWEVIVVDDGSTDGTPKVMQPYLADARFQYVRTDHVGQPAAKNIGIRATRGQYIAFLDADDAWLPEKLVLQVQRMASSNRIGVVYGRHLCMDNSGALLERSEGNPRRGDVLPHIFRDNFVCFSSSLVRREAFEQCGLFDEQIPLAIDYDLWLRISSKWQFDYVDAPVVYYRTGHANLSRRGEERLQIVLGIMRRFLEQQPPGKSLSNAIIRRSFADTYCTLGLVQRDQSVWRSLRSYCRAMLYQPFGRAAYRGMMAAVLPEPARRHLRHALGRPRSWQ